METPSWSGRNDDNGTDSGSAYIFERNAGGSDSWGEVAKLVASDGVAFDNFSTSVAISGDTVLVGSLGDGGNGVISGSAYIFERNAGGSDNWGEVAKLIASDGVARDNFGNSVAISGDIVLVGSRGDDDNGTNSGSAYIFERNAGGSDSWGEVAKLVASDGGIGDDFGNRVAISGDIVLVGSTGDDDNGFRSGSAYIFERNAGGSDSWGEVAISGDTVLVGSLGDGGKLIASDGAARDEFGTSVAISGNTVVAGSIGDDVNGSNSGSAYVFELAATEPIDPLGGLPIGGFSGWRASPWYQNYYADFWPWIFHAEHGWQYIFDTETEGEYIIYDLECDDFWWTSTAFEPLTFYSFNRGTFNFYFVGTTGPRSFVDLETGEFWKKP